jgi:hypothetical protein
MAPRPIQGQGELSAGLSDTGVARGCANIQRFTALGRYQHQPSVVAFAPIARIVLDSFPKWLSKVAFFCLS